MHIIPSFLVDKASCTRQFESELSLHSLASLFPIKEGIFSNPSVSLSKGSSTSNQAFLLRRKDVTALLGAQNRYALRLSDHQRSSTYCAGWDRMGSDAPTYTTRCSTLVYIISFSQLFDCYHSLSMSICK